MIKNNGRSEGVRLAMFIGSYIEIVGYTGVKYLGIMKAFSDNEFEVFDKENGILQFISRERVEAIFLRLPEKMIKVIESEDGK